MTVFARTVRATPFRSAAAAWDVIVTLLAPDGGEARTELMKVAGIAMSLIAAEATKADKIIVWGGGPRVRIDCLFDDDATSGDNSNETKLTRSATDGDWRMSLPCSEEDLTWVSAALAKKSARITARKLGEEPKTEDGEESNSSETINMEAFLRP